MQEYLFELQFTICQPMRTTQFQIQRVEESLILREDFFNSIISKLDQGVYQLLILLRSELFKILFILVTIQLRIKFLDFAKLQIIVRGTRWLLGKAAKEATTNGGQEILTGIVTIVPAVEKGKTRYDHRPTLNVFTTWQVK